MSAYKSLTKRTLEDILRDPEATRAERLDACRTLETIAQRYETRRVRQYEINQRRLAAMPKWVREEEGV